MMDYDPHARAPDSAWIPVVIGVIFALLMLVNATARAETQLVWEVPSGTNRDAGRWNCASDTTRVLTGTAWDTSSFAAFGSLAATANVFQCRADRPLLAGEGCPSPGNYSQESMQAKSLARLCALPPPQCPSPAPPADFQTVQCVAPQMGEWTQTRNYTCSTPPTWTAGEWVPTSPPAGACIDPVPVPTGNLTATPAVLTFGETFTLAWVFQNSLKCEGNWAPGALTSPGSIVLAPSVSMIYGMGCDSLPGAPSGSMFRVDVTVNPLPIPWTPPPLPSCWPVNFSLASVVRAIPSGDLRSLFSAFGLQELVSTDGTTSAFGWACDLPTGYGYAWFVMRHGSADQSCWRQIDFRSALTPQFFEAVWEVCSRELTDAEQELGADLRGAYAARFAVAAVAATTACPTGCRPVYQRSATGGVGARVVIGGVNQSIAVGQPCDGRRRLSGTTSRFNEVSGMQSVTNQTLPANAFAVCTKSDAPAAGWISMNLSPPVSAKSRWSNSRGGGTGARAG